VEHRNIILAVNVRRLDIASWLRTSQVRRDLLRAALARLLVIASWLLPSQVRADYREEWLAELSCIPRSWACLRFAVGLASRAGRIGREIRQHSSGRQAYREHREREYDLRLSGILLWRHFLKALRSTTAVVSFTEWAGRLTNGRIGRLQSWLILLVIWCMCWWWLSSG